MPHDFTKWRRADVVMRANERRLAYRCFMRLFNHAASRWQRVSLNLFAGHLRRVREGAEVRLAQKYWTRLYYYRHFSGGQGARTKPAAVRSDRFRVRVACDLMGRKHNVRFSFATVPDLPQIANAAESHFDQVCRAESPAGLPGVAFEVATLQRFDQRRQRWAQLSAQEQLFNNCQLFCFPPAGSVWQGDSKGVIPEAVDVFTWTTKEASPHRHRRPGAASGVAAPAPAAAGGAATAGGEKSRFVFYDICPVGINHLTFADLRAAFSRCDMQIEGSVLRALFAEADEDADGMVSLGEWQRFAVGNTGLLDALYFRMKDMYSSREAAARGGHDHITSISCLNDPTVTAKSPPLLQPRASEKLLLSQEVHRAAREADNLRTQHRAAEAKEAAAKHRLRACYG